MGGRIYDERIQPEAYAADRNRIESDAVNSLARICAIDIKDVLPVCDDRLSFQATAAKDNI